MVMVAVVADVKVKLPEKLPPKGVEWEAKTVGKPPRTTIIASIAGPRSSLFILIADHLHPGRSSNGDPAVSETGCSPIVFIPTIREET